MKTITKISPSILAMAATAASTIPVNHMVPTKKVKAERAWTGKPEPRKNRLTDVGTKAEESLRTQFMAALANFQTAGATLRHLVKQALEMEIEADTIVNWGVESGRTESWVRSVISMVRKEEFATMVNKPGQGRKIQPARLAFFEQLETFAIAHLPKGVKQEELPNVLEAAARYYSNKAKAIRKAIAAERKEAEAAKPVAK